MPQPWCIPVLVTLARAAAAVAGDGDGGRLDVRPGAMAGVIAVHRVGREAPLFVLNAKADFRPYLHPIYHPTGDAVVTRWPGDDPPKNGKPPGYTHHTGVWYGFGTGAGNTFYGTTLVHPRPLEAPQVSGNQVTWTVVSDWRNDGDAEKRKTDPKTFAVETQRWTFSDRGDAYVFDLEHHLLPTADLIGRKADYGGFFVKVPRGGPAIAGLPDGSTQIALKRVSDDMNAKPYRWFGMGHDQTGIAIVLMDHPGNPGHAVPWRTLPDHWGTSRCIAGEWTIPAQGGEWNRYRVVVRAGKVEAAWIETSWREFAALPKAGAAPATP